MTSRPKYATVQNPTMEAVMNELFRFETPEQALERMSAIRETFTTSKHQIENQATPSLILWVKGYGLTEEEEKEGRLGNYAMIAPKQLPDKKFTLYAIKLESELNVHPQKKRPKGKHPDWGHPALRQVQKGTVFATVEEARAIFQSLHEDYPAVTIPCTNKMYAIIYSRQHTPPVKKWVLTIEVAGPEGGFVIKANENTYEKPAELPGQKKPERAEGQPLEPQGYFTSKVALKKKVKKSG